MEKLNHSKGTMKTVILRLQPFITTANKVTTNVSQLQVQLKKTESLQIKLEHNKGSYDIQTISPF